MKFIHEETYTKLGINATKKLDVLKIVKEDILRILSERSESTSLETIKNGIKVAQSIISESLEETENL